MQGQSLGLCYLGNARIMAALQLAMEIQMSLHIKDKLLIKVDWVCIVYFSRFYLCLIVQYLDVFFFFPGSVYLFLNIEGKMSGCCITINVLLF